MNHLAQLTKKKAVDWTTTRGTEIIEEMPKITGVVMLLIPGPASLGVPKNIMQIY
tara:strand:- start:295 stop:459 length:165 start_codon:yes stop_codon:yes gene_type:complete